MSRSFVIKTYRLIIGVFILIAVLVQLFTFRQSTANFLSYFTVLSNLLVSFVFIFYSTNLFEQKKFDIIRGAATLYILITGFGFTFLLGGANQEFLGWVNVLLHYVTPIVVLLDWIFISSVKINFKESLVWILFMFLYLAYSLIRGLITSWYPYNFLNPKEVGVNGVIIYIGIVTVVSILISLFLTKTSGGRLYRKLKGLKNTIYTFKD